MPNYTGNLNLAKPIPMEDAADIQVINENMDKIDTWSMDIDEKTKAATSEIPGIVKYGTEAATALEGSKLAEILGIEYGGVLNNNNQKVAGKGYYDTANKKIYKCTANTSINYADAGYFIEVSNNDLLGKLQNLDYELIVGNNYIAKKYNNGILEISGQGLGYTTQPLGTTLYHTYPIKFAKIISLNVEFTRDITPDVQQFDINILIGSATNPDGFATVDIKRTINAYYYTFYKVIGLWK